MSSLNALTYLNFPTWVLFKSSRILSVMIGGLFILNKRQTSRDFIGAFLIVTGLVLFTLGDMDVQPAFNYWGKENRRREEKRREEKRREEKMNKNKSRRTIRRSKKTKKTKTGTFHVNT
jgi:hypothetical protein